MNYKSFTVYGFPRSGQHYLSALIARNFFDDSHYKGRTGAHTVVPHLHMASDAAFYIVRDFDAVAASIYRLRDVFRLRAPDMTALLSLPIELMFTPKMVGKVDLNDMDSIQRIEKGGGFFRSQRGLLKEAWNKHTKDWAELEHRHANVLFVQYDWLLSDFNPAMINIAKFLGSDKSEFENITERVGWYPPGEYWSKESSG